MAVRRLAAVAALGAALAGCGGSSGQGGAQRPGPLAWSRTPQVFIPRNLRSDRVLIATVRNASQRTLRLTAARVKVRDAAGRTLNGSAGFTNTYAHGLFGAFQQPSSLPTAELTRLGKIVVLKGGASAPFYAAWRLGRGSRQPVRIEYEGGRLDVPARARLAAP